MKKIILVVITSFFLKASWGQENINVESPLTLQQCVDVAIKNNADVRQSEFQSESNKVNLDQARASMLPGFSGYISHSLYNGRSINPYTNAYINQQYSAASYQLTTSITLWNGSSIQNYIHQYALAYEAGKMDVQQAKDKLTINIILNYLTVLSTEEQLSIAKQQAEATRRKVDLLVIKLGTDELTVLSTQNTLENAKLALAQLMNVPYSPKMKLLQLGSEDLPLPYDASVDDIYKNASQRLALVKAADLRIASANKNIQAVKGTLLPLLALSGGLYTNYSSAANTQQLINTTEVSTDNYVLINNVRTPVYAPQSTYKSTSIAYGSQWTNNLNSAVSVGLQIPIFNGLQVKSKLRQAKINQQEAVFQAGTVKLQLRQAIEQDYLNMTTAYETYKRVILQKEDYKESLHSAEIKYQEGAISTVDYVIVKNNFDQASINLVIAKYNYIMRAKILNFYQNRPLW
jgi:outer membrane protein